MTPEEMKFWIDVFHSPAVIAIAGGLAGSFITLVVALLKIWHDSKEREKAWQREENRRKEERTFANKISAYEAYLSSFKVNHENDIRTFEHNIKYSLLKIILYSPPNVRKKAIVLSLNVNAVIENDESTDVYKLATSKLAENTRNLYDEIIKDIENHYK